MDNFGLDKVRRGYEYEGMVKLKPRMGRPPKGDEAMMEPITIRLPKPMAAAITAIQARRMDAPDKATVIRELIAEALAPKKKGRGA